MTTLTSYTAFALIAILGNIGGQDITLRVYGGPFEVPVSILVGTALGLVVKYILDKRYVFKYETNHRQEDATLFALYSAMGVATTAVFWTIELGFDAVFDSRSMRYVGGVVGLICGYAIKYRLDQRFVFRTTPEVATCPSN